jgi:hypothetical protein
MKHWTKQPEFWAGITGWLILFAVAGCNVTTQVRPWFSKPPTEPPAVQPAPQPPPPKDDWAPPWFRRPKQ